MLGLDPGPETLALEEICQDAERHDNSDLNDQARFHKDVTEILQVRGEVLVCDVGYADCVHHLYNAGYEAEGCESSPWMQGREIGYVI